MTATDDAFTTPVWAERDQATLDLNIAKALQAEQDAEDAAYEAGLAACIARHPAGRDLP